jgi:hypothetical protein
MESEDVAALKVFNTGDNAMRAKKTKMDDFRVLVPAQRKNVSCKASRAPELLTTCVSLYRVRIRTIE